MGSGFFGFRERELPRYPPLFINDKDFSRNIAAKGENTQNIVIDPDYRDGAPLK